MCVCVFWLRHPACNAHAPYCHWKNTVVYSTFPHTAHLPQQCHNSKSVIFQEKILKVLKCYNFLWGQRRNNCSPAASFANCVMTLYLLKVHLQTFLSIPITQKMPNFELWHLSQMGDIWYKAWFSRDKKVTEHKMCVSIFSTTFVWNISHSKAVGYPGILFGGEFNKFSWGQRTERTGIWGR